MLGASAQRRVAVVGGGVIGCATAYQLARAGFAVTLIERDAIAAHASGCNAGNLNPLHGTPAALVPLALRAFHLHAEVHSELTALGCAHYIATPVGRIYLGYDEAERRKLEDTAALFGTTQGFSACWLDRHDLGRIEPRVAGDAAFGVLAQGNLTVDGYQFARSLADGATRLGTTILRDAAEGIVTCGGRATGIRTRCGVIVCDELVLATGPWVAEIKSWLGVDVAVEPVKGEILLMRPAAKPPLHDLTWGDTSIYRRGDGEVWVGTTMQRCGFDTTPTAAAKESLLACAARILPDIRYATLLAHRSALRPMSSSGEPIAARVHGWQNVYIANGSGSKGVLLSVGIARTIRDLLVDRDMVAPTIRDH